MNTGSKRMQRFTPKEKNDKNTRANAHYPTHFER